MMDSDFQIDLQELFSAVDKAEVITIFFPLLGRALLVDVRSDPTEGPLVTTVPMVPSVEERVRSLERLRPRFGRPKGIIAIPWYRWVESLRALGVIDSIAKRIEKCGGSSAACHAAFHDLLRSEREQRLEAVKGVGHQTLWRRQ